MRAIISAFLVLGILSSCAPVGVAVGAGAVVGTAASREGGIGQTWSDAKIRAYILDAWFKHNSDMFNSLELTVREQRVMITGTVKDPQWRVDAVRFAWQAPGVRQVVNEIRIQDSEGVSGYARDSWISTQLRTKLIFDKEIQSINYSFDCVGGIVYLMGVARDQEELDHVINHARGISYVKEVVSYVRLRTDVRPDESIDNNQYPAQ
jgi:osmotically-inducible protein OsmY